MIERPSHTALFLTVLLLGLGGTGFAVRGAEAAGAQTPGTPRGAEAGVVHAADAPSSGGGTGGTVTLPSGGSAAPSDPAAKVELGQTTPLRPLSPRPKLALVLSGGGARGAAEIGVLKVLEELHVPAELVVGTSMGSIVGGLYATGWSPDQMEELLATIDWSQVFIDKVGRSVKTFRRKQDDDRYFIPAKLRFKDGKPYLPTGLLGGQRLQLLLEHIGIQSTGETDFNRFPIPYRAVAADIGTGQTVVLDKGSVAMAMRASMSVPGAFPPVVIDGHTLVDGGAVANLPVRIAQSLGAEKIIAVDITSPLADPSKITSFLSVLSQQNGFLTVGNRLEDLAALRPGDLVIRPELGDISFSAFNRAREAVAIGEAAARARIDDLRKYSVSQAEWDAFVARHHRRPKSDLIVNDLAIENTSWVDTRVVEDGLHVKTGEPLDEKSLTDDLIRLFGTDYFGVIHNEFERADDKGTLTIVTPEKPYGRNSLQFGFSLRSDTYGQGTYTIAARHLFIAANRLGGEWENTLQIGNNGLIQSTFYQPLDYRMRWFVQPGVDAGQKYLSLFQDGDEVAEYKITSTEGWLDAGRVFGNWGEVRAGVFKGRIRGNLRVGPPVFPSFNEDEGGVRGSFTVDTRDATVFRHHGALGTIRYSVGVESMGATLTSHQGFISASYAWTFGKTTILPHAEVGTNFGSEGNLGSLFFLGGIGRLSGLAFNELIGDREGLLGVVGYQELTRLDLGELRMRIYAGVTAETGNVYSPGQAVAWDSLRHGGSIFVGADTLVGPIILAYGFSDGGRRTVLFDIGTRF